MAQGRAERAAAHENKKLKLPQLQTRSPLALFDEKP